MEAPAPAVPSQTGEKRPTDNLLEAVRRFQSRVEARTAALVASTSKLKPEEMLAQLIRILDQPSSGSAGGIADARIDRVVAAGLLCQVAERQPSLKQAIVALIRSRLPGEADPLVRDQLLGNVGGFPLRADAVIFRGAQGEARVVEIFVPGSIGPGEAWVGSLTTSAVADPSILDLVRGFAADKTNRSRAAAIQTLLSIPPEAGASIVADLYAADASIRTVALQPMLDRPRPEYLTAFASALRDGSETLLIGPMARALESSPVPPEGAGAALRSSYEKLPEGQDTPRFALVRAAASVYRSGHDADALRCLGAGMESPLPKLREEAARSAALYPDPGLSPLLHSRLPAARSDYERELISYALGKCDPSYNGPSLQREIDGLQSKLREQGTLEGRERLRIQAEIDLKERALEDLRDRR